MHMCYTQILAFSKIKDVHTFSVNAINFIY